MWRYYSYDVWGNPEDGFEVNEVFRTSTTAEAPRNATFAQLKKAFDIERGISEITAYDNEDISYLERERDGKPMGELRWEEPEPPRRGSEPLTPFFVNSTRTPTTEAIRLSAAADFASVQAERDESRQSHREARAAHQKAAQAWQALENIDKAQLHRRKSKEHDNIVGDR